MKLLIIAGVSVAVAAAGAAFAGGLGFSSSADVLVQQPDTRTFTIRGVVKAPGDEELPGNLRARLLDPLANTEAGGSGGREERLSAVQGRDDRYKVLQQAVVGSDGSFTFQRVRGGVYRIEIGDRRRSPWAITMAQVTTDDVDIGEIQLQPQIRQ